MGTEIAITQQIDRMLVSFADIARVCEDLEIVLAFENHLDYRVSEIAEECWKRSAQVRSSRGSKRCSNGNLTPLYRVIV